MGSADSDAIRVLCVEDLHFVAASICEDIDREPGLRSVGILPTPDNLLEETRRLQARVVLLDLRTGGRDSLEAMTELLRAMPEVRVIIVSGDNHPKMIERAFALGASGYVVKSEPREVVEAARAVAEGRKWLPRHPLRR